MLATAALLALATTAQAATKYNYGGRGFYEHRVYGSGHEAYKRDHEPSYESYYAEDDYWEPDHYSYGGDAYSEEPRKSRPTYEPQSGRMHKQSHVYKRSTRGELQRCPKICNTEGEGCEIFCNIPSCTGLCTTKAPPSLGTHVPCSTNSRAAGNRPFCYVSGPCRGAFKSIVNSNFFWSADACEDSEAPTPPVADTPVEA